LFYTKQIEFVGSGGVGLRDFRHRPDLSPDHAARIIAQPSLLRALKRRGK